MPSKNRAQIMGHLGRKPEIREMSNGDKVANMTIATTEKWKDKATGEQREKTEWHRIVCFIQPLMQYIEDWDKGDLVDVEGKLVTRKWTDQNGVERYTTEIEVRGFGGVMNFLRKAHSSGQVQQHDDGVSKEPEEEDDIPF